jgi:anthranilate/para-aminobenzoate synthase component I
MLLDGGGADSWLNGDVIYADAPRATLTIHPSGWARWTDGSDERWRWGDPLAQWDAFLASTTRAADGGAAGGVLTVLSYDLKHWIERLQRRLPWPRVPVLYAAHYDWCYRANHRTGTAHIAAASRDALHDRLCWYDAANKVRVLEPHLRTSASPHLETRTRARTRTRTRYDPSTRTSTSTDTRRCPRPALGRRAYTAMIARAQEYIAAGDVYEINLAQPFTAGATLADGPALFAAWAGRYPMPFAAYVDAGAWALVSNSPECLIARDGDRVATFPIKGTRRRDAGSAADAVAAALRADPKEQAEHVMVVDLERNDLGRLCVPGSIAVAELAAVRHYPALVHMTSEVGGRLRPGTAPGALLRAIFPGGSISGAPKVRAMQLIEELEPAARGFYTGAIGWTAPDGATRFNIAIRTAMLDAAGTTYWSGGGIVADSQPDREYEETLLKSETFFRALASLEGRPT